MNNGATPPKNTTGIDKNALYGNYQQSAQWRDDVARKATHKALDLIDGDDMNIKGGDRNEVHNHYGPSVVPWVIAAATAVMLGGVTLYSLRTSPPVATIPTTQSAPPASPAVSAAKLSPYVWDEIEQTRQPDGTWKPTGKSVRKRMQPDGSVQTQQPDGSWK
jgi:hypothetical protein